MERHVEESENGARGRDRTTDTAIFSRMLYQLSYPGLLFCGVSGLKTAKFVLATFPGNAFRRPCP